MSTKGWNHLHVVSHLGDNKGGIDGVSFYVDKIKSFDFKSHNTTISNCTWAFQEKLSNPIWLLNATQHVDNPINAFQIWSARQTQTRASENFLQNESRKILSFYLHFIVAIVTWAFIAATQSSLEYILLFMLSICKWLNFLLNFLRLLCRFSGEAKEKFSGRFGLINYDFR